MRIDALPGPRCWTLRLVIAVFVCVSVTPASAETFSQYLSKLRGDARASGISDKVISAAFKGLKPNMKLIPLTTRQPEFLQPVGRYLSKRVTSSQIRNGRKRVRKHAKDLAAAERRFGVNRYIVAAIWGLETNYGGYVGKSDIFRSLATLGWKRYRGEFFRKQFIDALHIMQTEKIGRRRMIGSWAGGMGQTQFIPSSYREHAVDFDGDGRRDLWRSTADALGSTANYLVKYGWVPGEPWGYPVILPKDLPRTAWTRPWKDWATAGVRRKDGGKFPAKSQATLLFPAGSEGPAYLVTQNYTAIRNYNWSDSYVLSVTRLAAHLSGRPPPTQKWPTRSPLLKPQRQKIQSLLAQKGYPVPNRIGRITLEMRKVIRDYQLSRGLVADGHPDLELLKALGG